MCTGGAYRPLRHDRHLSEASSFQIGVSPRPADGVERGTGLGLAYFVAGSGTLDGTRELIVPLIAC
jgi:hypothetical protein